MRTNELSPKKKVKPFPGSVTRNGRKSTLLRKVMCTGPGRQLGHEHPPGARDRGGKPGRH